jgi:hypothetical protein
LRVDFEFRVAVAALFALTLAVRTYYQLQSFRSGASQKFEGKTNAALRGMAGLALFALLAVYPRPTGTVNRPLLAPPLPCAWVRTDSSDDERDGNHKRP